MLSASYPSHHTVAPLGACSGPDGTLQGGSSSTGILPSASHTPVLSIHRNQHNIQCQTTKQQNCNFSLQFTMTFCPVPE